ncbi:single-stranded-DNA-specific exonuclease RecJ [Thalassotalea sp. 1_MG-2023]|uniref:single-stranded-DNA-specific exonuclease RecJ n=1 Tax=Thalassotalea sp. 1_MG-2023 TaxID=3062680 RepID=UPI0026E2881E|nr:single-stranded-DNA-specific exonuclease RecJ [Thalassotalea sp. 1_MG-2023]MDO6428038.1 single-stranded-DNA-specific exonuclease RecJ [Thalassotalea sp. 1_MG-2023]
MTQSMTITRRAIVDDSFLPNELHPTIKQIYASRGVNHADELTLNVNKLIDVKQLMGLDAACSVLHQAIISQETIVIVGDFDADGATSTALMMQALTWLGSKHHHFIVPNRFEYGYGLTPEIVDIAHQQKAKLLITVDSGISCLRGVAHAKSLEMKVIVTDHHLPGHTLPNADAIINPNQPGCQFPSKSLAGVGVAFYFMLAMRKYLRDINWFTEQGLAEPNLARLLDLVALGTVADVVSLDNNNRILVEQGLKRIRAGHTRPGIQALIEVANKDQRQLVASDFGFALGPRINAAGRLDDMSFGINCLLAPDMMSARAMAIELDALNKSRREIEQGMQQEAEIILQRLDVDINALPFAISLFHPQWHQGVIGIVAGRIKEKYYRPTIVFAANDVGDELKGSARSIVGLHIRDLLEHIDSQHPGLILKFGGHAMAAGLSIAKADFSRFQELFNQYAQQWIAADKLQGQLLTDGELAIKDMTLPFAELLRQSGPWGQAFPEPVFEGVFALEQQRIVGEKHLKLVLAKDKQMFDAIAFNVDINQWPNHAAKSVRVAYKLDINEFRGQRNVQLLVEQILVEPR